MSVNVNRSVSDQFYRYKMPRLIAKVTTRYWFFRFVSWGEKTSIRIVVGISLKFPKTSVGFDILKSCRKKCFSVNINMWAFPFNPG